MQTLIEQQTSLSRQLAEQQQQLHQQISAQNEKFEQQQQIFNQMMAQIKEIRIKQGPHIQWTPPSAGNIGKDLDRIPNFILVGDKGSEAGKGVMKLKTRLNHQCCLIPK